MIIFRTFISLFLIKTKIQKLIKCTFCTLVSKLGPIAIKVDWRYFLSLAFLKIGCLRSSVAVGL